MWDTREITERVSWCKKKISLKEVNVLLIKNVPNFSMTKIDLPNDLCELFVRRRRGGTHSCCCFMSGGFLTDMKDLGTVFYFLPCGVHLPFLQTHHEGHVRDRHPLPRFSEPQRDRRRFYLEPSLTGTFLTLSPESKRGFGLQGLFPFSEPPTPIPLNPASRSGYKTSQSVGKSESKPRQPWPLFDMAPRERSMR